MKKFLSHILPFFLIFALAMPAALPADAATKKKKATTTATTKKKKKKSSSKKSSSKKRKTTSKKKTTTRKKTGRVASSSAASTYTPPQSQVSSSRAVRTSAINPRVDSRKKIVVNKPNLDSIRNVTLNPSDKYYFPKLKAKYEINDTTMTPDEFRHFYLGYMFQEDFDPYRESPYSTVTDELRMKPTHTKEEIDTITKYALLSLEDNPFDLRQMSFLVHVLKEKRKDMRAKIWEYRLENLLGAIKSTGTGEDTDNAWYVIYPGHEYDMVQLLGYEATDASFIEPGYDYLTVQPDESDTRKRDKSAKGFYFNIIVPQEQYELKHPEDASVQEDMPITDTIRPSNIPSPEITDPDDVPAE